MHIKLSESDIRMIKALHVIITNKKAIIRQLEDDLSAVQYKLQHNIPCRKVYLTQIPEVIAKIKESRVLPVNQIMTLGQLGDCGNWAIAYVRKNGGQLYGIGFQTFHDFELHHVVVKANDQYFDAEGKASFIIAKHYLMTGKFAGSCEMDHCKLSEEEVFRLLPHTRESRIKYITEHYL